MPRPRSIRRQLELLTDVDLVRMVHRRPELAYLFRHALIQDAAYQSMLKADRRILHRTVAEALEQQYAEQTDTLEIAAVLAEHFAQGQVPERALHYFTRAGEAAAAQYANPEAITYFQRALELAAALPTTPALQAQSVTLSQRLGRLFELTSRYGEALACYETLEARARAQSDTALELFTLMERAKIRTTANAWYSLAEGAALLERARPLARALNDPAAEARILWTLVLLSVLACGDLAARRARSEEAEAIARTLANPEQLAFVLHDAWYVYGSVDTTRALQVVTEANTLWATLNNPPLLAESHMRIGLVQMTCARFALAHTHADKSVQIARACHNLDAQANCQTMAAFIQWEMGHVQDAFTQLAEAITLGQTLNNVTALSGGAGEQAWHYAYLGAFSEGTTRAQRAVEYSEQQFPLLTPWPKIILARIHLLQGDLPAAEALLAQLDYTKIRYGLNFIPHVWITFNLLHAELAYARGAFAVTLQRCDALLAELDSLTLAYRRYDILALKGRALDALAQPEAALTTLRAAHAHAQDCGATIALWSIAHALATCAAHCNDQAEAHAWHTRARADLRALLDHIPVDRRATFCALTAVQAVLSE